MHKPIVIGGLVLLTLALCCFTATAQTGSELGLGGQDGLQSGGGVDGGGQFPEGTEDCSGDRHHHAHDTPTDLCVKAFNAHYATMMGGGAPCQSRARHCSSCYTCCGLQRTEAENCHCFGSSTCKNAQVEVERTCRHACFGQFTDNCTKNP